MRVTIVIPTYNERENLRPLVERIAGLRIANLDTNLANVANDPNSHDSKVSRIRSDSQFVTPDILIIDDNSPDGTGMLADELAQEYAHTPSRSPSRREGEKRLMIRVLHRPRKEGLGAALLAGFERALADGADTIVQMDADGSHEPEEIPAMLAHIRDGVDVVIGSRRVLGGRITGWGIHRRLMSWAAQTLSRHLLGLRTRDVTSGFRAWRADALARVLEATPVYGS